MRLIKLGLLSFFFLALLVTIISLLMPSTIFVSRSININAPKDSVYAHLIDLRKWKEWCVNMDSATVVFSANSSGKNAFAKVDKTTITIDSANSESLSATWESGSSVLTSSFNFLPAGKATVTSLQWQFTNHVKWYPWEKYAAMFSDKSIGAFMEKSLDKMKATLEN